MPAGPRPLPATRRDLGISATSYRGLTRPLDRGGTLARRVPTPGPLGRSSTPTPSSTSQTSSRVSSLTSVISHDDMTKEKSQFLRERYQHLEEKSRPQRPVMLPSIRSFSYEMPTQAAEMEAMIRAQSSSPAAAPQVTPKPPPPDSHQEIP